LFETNLNPAHIEPGFYLREYLFKRVFIEWIWQLTQISEQNSLEHLQTLQQPAAVIKHGRLLFNKELQQLRSKAVDERSI
jgi:hypothetical protein